MDRRTFLHIKEMTRRNTPDLMRTFLANERTFLSFIRTSLTLFIVAFTLIKFVDHVLLEFSGWAFVAFGVATFFVGLTRYFRMKIIIRAFTKSYPENERRKQPEN
ncbi:MAG: DUF202 domain-containing protein [candidate division Zixibacteria bacterium]|nr:DUF202 domain-containing protein [candidate division Zixibacteria bacterium]